MVGDISRINGSLDQVDGLLGPLGSQVVAILGRLRQTDVHVINIQNSAVLQLTNLPVNVVGGLLGGGH
jgi:hypothetical protein